MSAPFGIAFDANPTMINVWATNSVPDDLTAEVTQLIMCGQSFFAIDPPGGQLGTYADHDVLARAPYGSGTAAFWADDWTFYNQEFGGGSHHQFAVNVARLGKSRLSIAAPFRPVRGLGEGRDRRGPTRRPVPD